MIGREDIGSGTVMSRLSVAEESEPKLFESDESDRDENTQGK